MCKDGDGRVGIKVKAVNKGIFVCLVTKDSPAAIGGLRLDNKYTVYYVPCTMYRVLCTVYYALCTMHCVLRTVYFILNVLCTAVFYIFTLSRFSSSHRAKSFFWLLTDYFLNSAYWLKMLIWFWLKSGSENEFKEFKPRR